MRSLRGARPARAARPEVVDGSSWRMVGNEPLWGYVVAAVLVAVGVLDLVVTKGRGAPTHPVLWTAGVGIALAVATAVSLRWRHRMLSPFVAVISVFFVTVSRVPYALSAPHLLAIVVAVGYAFVVTTRQRRADRALRGTGPGRGAGRGSGRGRRGSGESEEPAVRRPSANRRYTPPKAKATDARSRRK